jgi:hypothetical protein
MPCGYVSIWRRIFYARFSTMPNSYKPFLFQ